MLREEIEQVRVIATEIVKKSIAEEIIGKNIQEMIDTAIEKAIAKFNKVTPVAKTNKASGADKGGE